MRTVVLKFFCYLTISPATSASSVGSNSSLAQAKTFVYLFRLGPLGTLCQAVFFQNVKKEEFK